MALTIKLTATETRVLLGVRARGTAYTARTDIEGRALRSLRAFGLVEVGPGGSQLTDAGRELTADVRYEL